MLKEAQARILIAGSVAFDRITYPGGSTKVVSGGTAGNIAYGLALLGGSSSLFSCVGHDAGNYMKRIKKIGVAVDRVRLSDCQTSSAVIRITGNGYQGEFSLNSQSQLESMELPDGFDIYFLSTSLPSALSKWSEQCRARGYRHIIDVGRRVYHADPTQTLQMLSAAELSFCNEDEFEWLKRQSGGAQFWKRFVVTKARQGATIFDDSSAIPIPPVRPRRIVDTVGAGDAFRAGFVKGMINGYDLETSGKMGSLMASLSLTGEGGQTYTTSKEEFERMYFEKFGIKIEL